MKENQDILTAIGTLEERAEARRALDELAQASFRAEYLIKIKEISKDNSQASTALYNKAQDFLNMLDDIETNLSSPTLKSQTPKLTGDPPPERDWIIKNWLPANCVSMLTGEGGVGKSYLALQVASALATGFKDCYFLEQENPTSTPPCNVVYAAWEDELDEVARRIRYIKGQLKWPDLAKIERHFSYIDLKQLGPAWGPAEEKHISVRGSLLASGKALLRICEEKKASLLVLDPSAGAFGGNENDRAAVREYTGYLSGWCVENTCAVWLLAHPPKSESSYSGSTDWLGSVRSLWNLGKRKEDSKEYFSIKHTKSNYSLLQPERFLKRGDYGVWREVNTLNEANITQTRQGHTPQEEDTDDEYDATDEAIAAAFDRLK